MMMMMIFVSLGCKISAVTGNDSKVFSVSAVTRHTVTLHFSAYSVASELNLDGELGL